MTSGPIPSPGKSVILCVFDMELLALKMSVESAKAHGKCNGKKRSTS
jgi:hypothetical protein